MCLIAGPPRVCVTELKTSIIAPRLSAGCDYAQRADNLLSLAIEIISKWQTRAQIYLVSRSNLRNKRLFSWSMFTPRTLFSPLKFAMGRFWREQPDSALFWRCSEYRFCMTVWIKEWLSLLLSCSHLCLLSLWDGQQEFPSINQKPMPGSAIADPPNKPKCRRKCGNNTNKIEKKRDKHLLHVIDAQELISSLLVGENGWETTA